jgi:hypothetical protein
MIFTDDQDAAVRRAVHPLDHMQREAFMYALSILLTDRATVGDGELYQMLRDLQRVHMIYPEVRGPARPRSYHPE